jgi:chromatin modification-related protein EAF6
MAENAPPASASNAASDASRGMPYYERLRRDLRESLQKKRLVDNNLVRRWRDTSIDVDMSTAR